MSALAAIVLAGCSTPAAQPTPQPAAAPTTAQVSASAPTAAPTVQPPRAATLLPTAIQPPPATAAGPRVTAHVADPPIGVLSEIDTELEFVTPLANFAVINDIAARLQNAPGIFELRGDTRSVTVIYDTSQITPTRIREVFGQLGYPVRGGTEVVDPGVSAD